MQFIIFFFILLSSVCASQRGSHSYPFAENRGQANPCVQFLASSADASVLFTSDGVEFLGASASGNIEKLRLGFGAAQPLQWQGIASGPLLYSYALAGPTKRHAQDVQRFQRIRATAVYPGIDLVFYFSGQRLEYDFEVSPGADPSRIILQFHAPHAVDRLVTGGFQSQIAQRPWTQKPPVVYQQLASARREVSSQWKALGGNRYQFQSAAYDHSLPLTVDPIVEFSSYLGGPGDEEITVMGDGFVAGNTTSELLDGASGPPRRGRDVFFRTQGSPALAAANTVNWRDRMIIYGGSGDDTLSGAGASFSQTFLSITMGGTTSSQDLPYPGPSGYAGGASDCFALSYTYSTGSGSINQPVYSGSYFGGSGEDRCTSAVPQGNLLLVAGVTDSPNLPIARALQSSLGGGRDAFYSMFVINGSAPPPFSSYFGGEGDDSALHVRIGSNSVLLSGETRSPQIPNLPGELSGPSDGFFLEAGPIFASATAPLPDSLSLLRALRFGGSGEDRLTASLRTSSQYILAGETTSQDFPTANSSQASHAGGLDAFLIRLSTQDASVLSSTFFGGSGDDTARALSVLADNAVILAGDTTSPNLPTRDAVQIELRGPSDAFYAFFNPDSTPFSVSYFGGSGEERLHTVSAAAYAPVRLGGATNSSDFSLVNNWQPSAQGGWEAFATDIGFPYFTAPEKVYAAPGIRTDLLIRPSQPWRTAIVTARVENPALATIRLGQNSAAEMALPGPFGFNIEGLAESGETFVTISSDGFPTKRVRVILGKAVGIVSSLPPTLPPYSRTSSFRYALDILDTNTNLLTNTPHSTLLPNSVLWRSSDPSVLSFVGTASVWDGFLLSHKPGRASIFVESAFPFWPPEGHSIQVLPQRLLSPAQPILATPLHTSLFSFSFPSAISVTGFGIQGAFLVQSEDPTKLLVGPDGQYFAPSFERIVAANPGGGSGVIYLKALDSSGAVRVRISSQDLLEDVYATVELRSLVFHPTLSLTGGFNRGTDAIVSPGTLATYDGVLRIEGENSQTTVSTPNQLISVKVESANPALARITNSIWSHDGVVRTSPSISFPALGSTELISTSLTPHLKIAHRQKVDISDTLPAPYAAPPLRLGKHLTYGYSLNPLTRITGDVEVVVDDPSLIRLSRGSPTELASSLRIPGGGYLSFAVHGLADSGSTNIRIRLAGFAESVLPVQLFPSGFAFRDDSASFDYRNSLASSIVASYLLDPLTLAPLEEQFVSPTFRPNLAFTRDSEDLTLSMAACVLNNITHCSLRFTWQRTGRFEVALNPVEGFTLASIRQRLRVTVSTTSFSTSGSVAVRGCLTQLNVQAFFNNPNTSPLRVTATITSLDPAKVLFSDSPTSPGKESLTFTTPSPTGQTVYVHGLGEPGTFARYIVEGVGIDKIESQIPIYDWTFSLNRRFNGLAGASSILLGVPAAYDVALISTSGYSTLGAIPGAPPISFEPHFGDPSLAEFDRRLDRTFPPGTGSRETSIMGLSLGSTTVRLISGGKSSPPQDLLIRLPRLLSTSHLQPSQTRGTLGFGLETGAPGPRDNTLVTLRSLDPSRLLLQTSSSSAPGLPSITTIWGINSPAFSFRVDALSGEGMVEVEVSAPGYETQTAKVYLIPLMIGFDASSLPDSLTAGQTANLNVAIRATIPPELSQLPNLSITTYEFRPGFDASSIPIEVDIDDPSLLELTGDPPRIRNGYSAALQLKGLAPGSTTVRLRTPPGLASPPMSQSVRAFRIQKPRLSLLCNPQVGFETTNSCSGGSIPRPTGLPLTIRSANPARLLISSRRDAPGLPELTIPPDAVFVPEIVFHGLARDGVTNFTVSAPGYEDAVGRATHLETVFLFPDTLSTSTPNPLPPNGQRDLIVEMHTLGSTGTSLGWQSSGLRPGALPVTIPIRVADPTVLSVSPSQVIFQPGESRKTVLVRALKPGSSTVEVLAPPGFPAPVPAAVLIRVNP